MSEKKDVTISGPTATAFLSAIAPAGSFVAKANKTPIILLELIFILTILSVGSGIFAFFLKPIIVLSENQILYIFSTAAQVIAGLYGLTITGYELMNNRLNNAVINDDTLYDAVEGLKKKYYSIILTTGILCISAILFSLLNIGTYKALDGVNSLYSYMLNQSIVLIVAEVILIVVFSWQAIDPNKISKISDSSIKKDVKNKGDLGDFLKYYNLIEETVISLSDDIVKSNITVLNIQQEKYDRKGKREYKPSIISALNILNSKEIISKELVMQINELRQYRNYVVHGTDPMVDTDMNNQIKRIYYEVSERIAGYKAKEST